MHGNDNQEKVPCETSTFGWMWPTVLLVHSDCRILWSTIYLEGINWYLRIFAWRNASREGSIWDYQFWLGEARFISHPIFSKELQHPQKSKNLPLLFLFWHMNHGKNSELVSISVKIEYTYLWHVGFCLIFLFLFNYFLAFFYLEWWSI